MNISEINNISEERHLGKLFPEIVEASCKKAFTRTTYKKFEDNNETCSGSGANGVLHESVAASSVFMARSVPSEMTLEDLAIVTEEFALIKDSELGEYDQISIQDFMLEKLIFEILTEKRQPPEKLKHEQIFALKDYFLKIKTFKEVGLDLAQNGFIKRVNLAGNRDTASSRVSEGIAGLVDWLKPCGADVESVTKVLKSLRGKQAKQEHDKWLDSFEKWFKDPMDIPKKFEFDKSTFKDKLFVDNFFKRLNVFFVRSYSKGVIEPVIEKHGFILKVGEERYLIATNKGRKLPLPEDGSADEYLTQRVRKGKMNLIMLLLGYSCELNRAFRPLTVFDHAPYIGKHVDLRFGANNAKDYNNGAEIIVPNSYKGNKLFPYVSPEDINLGKMKVSFYEPGEKDSTKPDFNKPVLEVLLKSRDESDYESNYLGSHADFEVNNGARRKVPHDLLKYLLDKRQTLPVLPQVCKVVNAHGHKSVSLARNQIGIPPGFSHGTIKIDIYGSNGEKFLGLWSPEQDTKESEPFLLVRATESGFVKALN